jgi:transposase
MERRNMMIGKKRTKQGRIKSKRSATEAVVQQMPNTPLCGIDIGDNTSVAALFSPTCDLVDSFSFDMVSQGYQLFSSGVPKDARIGCEATGMAYPLVRALKEMGYSDITVANPKQLSWIVKSKKKSDKIDSEKIAKLLMAGILRGSIVGQRRAAFQ